MKKNFVISAFLIGLFFMKPTFSSAEETVIKIEVPAYVEKVDIKYENKSSSKMDKSIDSAKAATNKTVKNTKKAAEEASQKTQSHMERIKYYVDQGYTYAQAIQAVEDEEGGPVTRAQLVQRLIAQGYDPETAESLIPQNVDQRIDYAREQGRAEGQRRIQEFDQQLNNIRNGRR